MSKVSWLHISDIHITKPTKPTEAAAYDQKLVIDGFFDFLKNRFPQKHIQRPQFVVVTGDLAFSGSKENYQGNGDFSVLSFLKTLGSTLGYSEHELASRFHLIPGNHDICRDDLLLEDEEQLRYTWAQEPGEVNKLLLATTGQYKDARERTLRRLGNYFDFYKAFKNRTDLSIDDVLWYREKVALPDISAVVNIIGACSSWLCGSFWAAEMKGGLEEKKTERTDFLRLGEPKVRELLEGVDTSELNIILMHHDYEITGDRNNKILTPLIHKKCNFILCGHEHVNTWAEPIDGIAHKIRAGCLYHSVHHRAAFHLTEVENDMVKMMTVQYRPHDKKWGIDKDADPTHGHDKFGYKFDGRTGLLTYPLYQREDREPVPAIIPPGFVEDGTVVTESKEEIKTVQVEQGEPVDFGFSIRCPYCSKWRDWNVPLKDYVVASEVEFEDIMKELADKGASAKLLRCRQPSWECPAPFEALVYDSEPLALSSLEKIKENWTLRRDFRLFRPDHESRWEGKYYGTLFCTKPVQRQRSIELERLFGRRQLSRIISGISTNVEGPVTIYGGNIFNDQLFWMPIEGDIELPANVPAKYNPLCKTCRTIVMESIVAEFVGKGASPQNCDIGFGDANRGTCAGKPAACLTGDWNHCPDFINRRLRVCPCYHSDYNLIETDLVTAWRQNELEPGQGIIGRCHLGMKEFAFPMIVHDHLIGVAMTGQIVDDPEELRDIDNVVEEWELLKERKDELHEAKHELLSGGYNYIVKRDNLARRASLGAAIDLIQEMSETRYYDIRTRSEAAFEEELLSQIRAAISKPEFFKHQMVHLLSRMREFWAFKTLVFLHHSFKTSEVHIIDLVSEGIDPQAFGFPGISVGKINVEYRQKYALPFFYDTDNPESPVNPWARQFLPLIDKADEMFHLPKGRCYFTVCLPVNDSNAFALVCAVRDPKGVSKTRVRKAGGISQPAQEFILKTCSEVMINLQLKGFFENVLDVF